MYANALIMMNHLLFVRLYGVSGALVWIAAPFSKREEVVCTAKSDFF